MNLIKNHKMRLKIYQNIYLSNYSTIKIGGKARFFAKPQNLEQFDFTIKFCNSHGLKPFIFGSGANILFSEKIKDDIFFISLQDFNDFEMDEEKIIVSAGFPASLLPFFGLDDLFFLYLLPGTTAAATYMNVKYDRFELGSFISKILYIDLSDNQIREIEQKDSQFSYKHSIFQEKNNWIILKIYFDKLKRDRFQVNNNEHYIEIEKSGLNKLKIDDSKLNQRILKNINLFDTDIDKIKLEKIKFLLNRSRKKYSDLNKFYKFFSIKNIFNLLKYKKYLQSELQNIIFQCFSLSDEILLKMKSIEEYRLSKNHFKYPSLGSIFKNNYSFGVATGALVDKLGLKGTIYKGAQIAPYHGNIIINIKNARSSDVIYLIRLIQEKINKSFGFVPQPEIIIFEEKIF